MNLVKLKYLLFSGLMIIMLSSCYKMRVEVYHIPSNTPENADIYITGDFNNWDPGDEKYILKKFVDSIWFVDLPVGAGLLEYKFTRGDWTSVEKDNCGNEMENHSLQYGDDEGVAQNVIRSWADLDPVDCDELTIILSSLPENTPVGAIFSLVGNINGWDVTDEDYTFEIDDSLKLPLLKIYRPEDLERLDFLITRGGLGRSEADGLGREIKPRRIWFGDADTIFVDVKSWLDLEKSKSNMITLIVENIPKNTPEDDPIFFVGEVNDWYPQDIGLRLEKNNLNQYFINLPKLAYDKEYKFTRGSWKTVEADKYGYEINNHTLTQENSSDTVRVNICNWTDLSEESGGEILIRLMHIPENTPATSYIHIAGNFNNWDPDDASWRLKKDADGTYFIYIPRDRNMLEFKFTHGSWNTVELDAEGEEISNRIYRYGDVDTLELMVEKWKGL